MQKELIRTLCLLARDYPHEVNKTILNKFSETVQWQLEVGEFLHVPFTLKTTSEMNGKLFLKPNMTFCPWAPQLYVQ